MLCLGEHIHGDPVRIGTLIRNDHNFGRACDHIYPYNAENKPFGGRDVTVSRPDDLVNRGDGPGAVGQGRDGLCPADGKHPVDPRYLRRSQDDGIDFIIYSRYGHDDFP